MKKQLLIPALLLLALVSAIFFVDYLVFNLVGVIANAFNAPVFFYENIFPYLMTLIITASIAYPLTAILLNNDKQMTTKIFSIHSKNENIESLKQTA
jgi:hypothetical protein